MPDNRVNQSRRFRAPIFVALALALLSTVVGVTPAAAAVIDRGATVQCRYEYVSEDSIYWGGVLRRIRVTPPNMKSLTSSGQTVGWRFVVQRIRFDRPQPWTWKTTYKSPIQLATAYSDQKASFTSMRVDVQPVIDPELSGLNEVHYRVKLKLFWYSASGTVHQLVTDKIDRYQNWELGVDYWWTQDGDYACPGGHSDFVDGPG